MNLSDAELALIGTAVGSVGLEITRRLLDRKSKQSTEGNAIREELRNSVQDLRDQLAAAKLREQQLDDEVEEWRSKFYDKRDEDIKSQTNLMIANGRIATLEIEIHALKDKLDEIEKRILPTN